MKITGFKIFMVGNYWKSWPIIKILQMKEIMELEKVV